MVAIDQRPPPCSGGSQATQEPQQPVLRPSCGGAPFVMVLSHRKYGMAIAVRWPNYLAEFQLVRCGARIDCKAHWRFQL